MRWKRFALLCFTAFLALQTSGAVAAEYCSSLWHSRHSNKLGYTYDQNSMFAAQQAAAYYCGENDCMIVAFCGGDCGAIARYGSVGPNNNFSVALREGSTRWDAEQAAIYACTTAPGGPGRQCSMVQWRCSRQSDGSYRGARSQQQPRSPVATLFEALRPGNLSLTHAGQKK